MKSIGNWWNDRNIELVEVQNNVYALYGWNGESYGHCWKCTGDFYMDASTEEYELVPIYSKAGEIIDYEANRT